MHAVVSSRGSVSTDKVVCWQQLHRLVTSQHAPAVASTHKPSTAPVPVMHAYIHQASKPISCVKNNSRHTPGPPPPPLGVSTGTSPCAPPPSLSLHASPTHPPPLSPLGVFTPLPLLTHSPPSPPFPPSSPPPCPPRPPSCMPPCCVSWPTSVCQTCWASALAAGPWTPPVRQQQQCWLRLWLSCDRLLGCMTTWPSRCCRHSSSHSKETGGSHLR